MTQHNFLSDNNLIMLNKGDKKDLEYTHSWIASDSQYTKRFIVNTNNPF